MLGMCIQDEAERSGEKDLPRRRAPHPPARFGNYLSLPSGDVRRCREPLCSRDRLAIHLPVSASDFAAYNRICTRHICNPQRQRRAIRRSAARRKAKSGVFLARKRRHDRLIVAAGIDTTPMVRVAIGNAPQRRLGAGVDCSYDVMPVAMAMLACCKAGRHCCGGERHGQCDFHHRSCRKKACRTHGPSPLQIKRQCFIK